VGRVAGSVNNAAVDRVTKGEKSSSPPRPATATSAQVPPERPRPSPGPPRRGSALATPKLSAGKTMNKKQQSSPPRQATATSAPMPPKRHLFSSATSSTTGSQTMRARRLILLDIASFSCPALNLVCAASLAAVFRWVAGGVTASSSEDPLYRSSATGDTISLR
jgi:hypothetical protein